MISRLYKKRYTMAEWNRFPYHMQQILCRKYDVIITDWIPKRQRIINRINGIIDKVQRTTDKISQSVDKINMKDFKLFPGASQNQYNDLVGMPKRDYSGLMGKRTKRDYKALIG